MKIVVMGSGNVGSILGATLTEAGQDVTLVDVRDDLIEAIQKNGIKLNMTNGQTKQIKVKITNDASSAGIADLVIIVTKGFATRTALENAMSTIDKNTYVLSVQNGAGNIELIAEILGDDSHVIGGTWHNNVYPTYPDKTNELTWMWRSDDNLKIGPMNGVMNAMVEKIPDMFRGTGVQVYTTTKAQDLIWNKLMFNVDMPVASLLKIAVDDFGDYPTVPELVQMLADECIKVAKAKGVTMQHSKYPMENITMYKKSGVPLLCSMLQDILHGRKTEIDTINAAVVREGEKYNIPTPANHIMTLLVKALEMTTAKNQGK